MDRVSWIDQYIAQATDILILNHGLRRTFAEKWRISETGGIDLFNWIHLTIPVLFPLLWDEVETG